MSDVVSRLNETDPGDTWIGTATVTSISVPPTPDGRRLIGLNWLGTAMTAPYASSYTPLVGHQVTFLKAGSSYFVLGTAARI